MADDKSTSKILEIQPSSPFLVQKSLKVTDKPIDSRLRHFSMIVMVGSDKEPRSCMNDKAPSVTTQPHRRDLNTVLYILGLIRRGLDANLSEKDSLRDRACVGTRENYLC